MISIKNLMKVTAISASLTSPVKSKSKTTLHLKSKSKKNKSKKSHK